MHIPGLLIEYLMTGGLAVVLLTPVYLSHSQEVPAWLEDLGGLKALVALVAVPVVYIVGLVLDFLGSVALRPLKRRIREGVRREWKADGNPLPPQRHEKLLTSYIRSREPDLGNEYESRSSRDRIARGAMVNCLIGAVAYALCPSWPLAAALLGTSLVLSPIWWRAERASFAFKLKAWYVTSEAGRSAIEHREE